MISNDLAVTPAAVRVNTTKTTTGVETSEVFHFLSRDEPIFVQVGGKTKHQRPGQVLNHWTPQQSVYRGFVVV